MRIAPARRALVWALAATFGLAAFPATLFALPKVPNGFKVRLVAAVPAVTYPSQVATAPDGSLFVAEDPMDQIGPYDTDDGRILLFREGKEPVVFAEGFRPIFGMAWHDGALYVMNMPRLTVLRDTNGDGKADSRKDIFKDLGKGPHGFNDHIVSGIQFGMDGWLYISVGDKGVHGVHGNDGRYAQLKGGGTMRCRPDGTGIEVYTSGTRNHLEVNLDERDNMFTYDNTDDGLGWWTRVTHHMDGGYFGYPFDYHDRNDKHLPRLAEYGGGSPCGGILYKEDVWPAEYRGRAFWAEWGKRHVAAIKFAPEGASYKVVDYMKFLEPGEGESINPLDLTLSYDGKTLYVADWGMGGWSNKTEKVGKIYAVTYVGPSDAKPRGNDSDPIPAQIKSLSHASFNERMRAQTALIKKGNEALAPVVAALKDSKTDDVAKRHLIWTLDGIAGGKPEANAVLVEMLKSPVPDLRAQAARTIGLRGVTAAVEPLIAAVKDSDPTVRLQAIISLGRIKDARAIPALIHTVVDSDRYVAFAGRVALRRINDWKATAAGISPSTDAKIRKEILGALEDQYDVDAVGLLKSVASDASRPVEERSKAYAFLAEAYMKARPWDGNWWGTRPAAGKPPEKVVSWDGTTLVGDTVLAGLADANEAIRLAAVSALREMNDKATFAKLREQFTRETSDAVRKEIVVSLGTLEDKASLPLLIGALRDAKSADSLREAALASVEKIGGSDATKALVELLGEANLKADRQVRVIAALGRAKARGAVPAIVKALGSSDAKVRASAAEALGLIGDTKVSSAVRDRLKDASVDVRKASVVALGSLRDREAIPLLIDSANDENVRFEATTALGAMPDIRAIHVYLRGLGEKSPELRKASTSAMIAVREKALPILEELHKRKELPSAALPELRKVFSAVQPIMKWHIVGPFAERGRPPFATNGKIDVTKPVTIGDKKPIEWRETKVVDEHGQVDVTKLLNEIDNKSVFAYAEINSPMARQARMAVGSDDTLTVWLNGKSVYRFDTNRGFTPEVDSVEVNLNKGVNRVLVRCGNTGGPWAFSVGITGTDGEYAFLKGNDAGGFNADQFRKTAMAGKGKAEHGKELFNDLKGVACIKCHAVAGKGGQVGPELSAVGLKYPREEIITSVLLPSQKISSGYEPVVLATADGKVLTGILKSETPEAIEIEDVDAKRIKVLKTDLDGRKQSEVSLMPNGLAEGLTAGDFADLIAYLETLKDTSALHAPAPNASKPK